LPAFLLEHARAPWADQGGAPRGPAALPTVGCAEAAVGAEGVPVLAHLPHRLRRGAQASFSGAPRSVSRVLLDRSSSGVDRRVEVSVSTMTDSARAWGMPSLTSSCSTVIELVPTRTTREPTSTSPGHNSSLRYSIVIFASTKSRAGSAATCRS